MKKQVAVIFGGKSSEHEVSCHSVLNVIKGFSPEKYEIHLIGITKEGQWLYVPSPQTIEDGSWVEGKETAIISPDAVKSGIYLCHEEGHFERIKIDVIFPVLHGKFGEDGTIQGVFEMSGIPYVGCGVLSSSVSMDKISTKVFVEKLGIRQAKFVADIAPDLSLLEETVQQVEEKLGYPVFVKPSNAGSSCGVSKAENRDELIEAVALAKKHDTRVLIEEMIVEYETNSKTSKCKALVGATYDNNGELSYGGIKYTGRGVKYESMGPDYRGKCDTLCMNCVLVDKDTFFRCGNFDGKYRHSLADFDYGLKLSRELGDIFMFSRCVGMCNKNPIAGTWQDTTLRRSKRLKLKESIKGAPFGTWVYFLNKYFGLRKAIIYGISPYIRILLGK